MNIVKNLSQCNAVKKGIALSTLRGLSHHHEKTKVSPLSGNAFLDAPLSHNIIRKWRDTLIPLKFNLEMHLRMYKKLIWRCISIIPISSLACELFGDVSPEYVLLIQKRNRQKQWHNENEHQNKYYIDKDYINLTLLSFKTGGSGHYNILIISSADL